MKTIQPMTRPRKPAETDLVAQLSQRVIGQPSAIQAIVPYVQMFQAGLAPEGRPVGIFLLLGPTGTGKTKTVEALAEILHGSDRMMIKVDCGEFQMEHEVAKLIGAPPGYLGHRETQPMLTQQKLNSVASEKCGLSIVLFDEIEKAAPSMTRLLLGVLDKALLRLGDNTSVNFERSLIFLTSNLGAREMLKEIQPDFGFLAGRPGERGDVVRKLQSIGLNAVRRKFSPEFVNRVDAVITYQPLEAASLEAILEQQIDQLQQHISNRLGPRAFRLDVPEASRELLLKLGTSREYGARELNRTIHRRITQPLAAMVAASQIEPGARVRIDPDPSGDGLEIHVVDAAAESAAARPAILIVDDNQELLRFLEHLMACSGWKLLTAESAAAAQLLVARERPDAALIDYFLPDGTGVNLGVRLRKRNPDLPVLIMSGLDLSAEDQASCERHGFVVLQKPFLASEIVQELQTRLSAAAPVTQAA